MNKKANNLMKSEKNQEVDHAINNYKIRISELHLKLLNHSKEK